MGHSPDRTNHFSRGRGDTENRHKEARLVSSGFVWRSGLNGTFLH